jgi:hypothetical protein
MSWATVAETLTYTGITVGQDNIDAAQAMVELFADVTEDSNANISSKNLRLLKMAVAYQAAWMTDHPDVFTNVDVSTMLQDGLQFTNAHANAGILAPLAKRAIDRLSWRRNRSIRIRKTRRNTCFGGGTVSSTPFQDEDLPWQGL